MARKALEAVHDRGGQVVDTGSAGAVGPEALAFGIDDHARDREDGRRLARAIEPIPHAREHALDAGRTRLVDRPGWHRSSFGNELEWRERVGVEPTAPRRARRHR